jgi:hypothetical protein
MSTSLSGMGNVDSAGSIDQLIQAASAPPPTSSSGGFRKVLGGLVGGAANVFAPGLGSVIGNVIGGGGGAGGGLSGAMTPTQALQIQQQMTMESEIFTTASTVLKDRHDSAMTAIQNSKSS